MPADATRSAPITHDVSEGWSELQSTISELHETAATIAEVLRDQTPAPGQQHPLAEKAAELDRIRGRLAKLREEISAIPPPRR